MGRGMKMSRRAFAGVAPQGCHLKSVPMITKEIMERMEVSHGPLWRKLRTEAESLKAACKKLPSRAKIALSGGCAGKTYKKVAHYYYAVRGLLDCEMSLEEERTVSEYFGQLCGWLSALHQIIIIIINEKNNTPDDVTQHHE